MLRTLTIGALVLALAALSWLPAPPARAQTDLTGTWNIALNGFYPIDCSNSQIVQSGTALTMTGPCVPLPVTGSFDKSTGIFNLGGCFPNSTCMGMNGTVSPDGNSMSGTWVTNNINVGGPFSGTRKLPGTATPTTTSTATETPTLVPPELGGVAQRPDLGSGGSGLWASIMAAAAGGLLVLGAGGIALRRRR